MRAKIYQPARNAMQSGTAKTHEWVLEYAPTGRKRIDPLMGWSGSKGVSGQIKMKFESKEAAMAYANNNGVNFDILENTSHDRQPNIRKMGYAENFSHNRRAPWTH